MFSGCELPDSSAVVNIETGSDYSKQNNILHIAHNKTVRSAISARKNART